MSALAGVKAALGTVWAALAIPIVLFSFVGLSALEPRLVAWTGLEISPRYTGGEVARTHDRGTHRTRIHEPVFAALIGQGKTGFVQIDFARIDSTSVLPPTIDEGVDLDDDGAVDFRVFVETGPGTVRIEGMSPWILGMDEMIPIDDGLAVRVKLKRGRWTLVPDGRVASKRIDPADERGGARK